MNTPIPLSKKEWLDSSKKEHHSQDTATRESLEALHVKASAKLLNAEPRGSQRQSPKDLAEIAFQDLQLAGLDPREMISVTAHLIGLISDTLEEKSKLRGL